MYEKEIINEFFKDIREFKKNVLEKTNNTFKISFIKYIKDKNNKNIDTKRFTLQKSFLGKNLDKVIFNNKIYFKNRQKFENIYISLDNTNTRTNLLWLDDVKIENFNKEQLKYMTLIETSPNNYQSFIILDKEITREQLKQVKLYFCNKYGTDRGSVDFTHLMRLPFFYSYKHETPFLVNVRMYQEKLLHIDTLLKSIEKIKIKNEKVKLYSKNRIQNNNLDLYKLKKFYDEYFDKKLKEFENKKDFNVIDFRFLHYLYYFLNIDIENIDLESFLYNLDERKRGHIDDYITRTIEKVKNIYDVNERYENFDYKLLEEIFNKYIKE